MRRALTTAVLSITALLIAAQVALAESDVGHDGGEGWYGETNDRIVTNFGFALIIFFPLFVLFASIAYHKLEGRRVARLKAEKARLSRADERGGW